MQPVTRSAIPAAAAPVYTQASIVNPSEIAKHMVSQLLGKQSLVSTLTPVAMECPTLYEDMLRIIEAEHPELRGEFNNQWNDTFLVLRPADARKLVALHEASGAEEVPKLILAAHETMLMLHTFDNEKQADRFATIHLANIKKLYDLQLKVRGWVPEEGVPTSATLMKMNQTSAALDFCKAVLKQQCADFNLETMPAYRHVNLIKNADKDPFLEEIAPNSKNYLSQYNYRLKNALEGSNAAERPDFDACIFADPVTWDGVMLFSRYGMEPAPTEDEYLQSMYPFFHSLVMKKDASFGYRFDNASPADLEDEIRSDLEKYGITEEYLPERIYTDHTPSMVLNEGQKILKAKFCHALDKWSSLNQEQVAEFKDDLFQCTTLAMWGFKKEEMQEIERKEEIITFKMMSRGCVVPMALDLRTFTWYVAGLTTIPDSLVSFEVLSVTFRGTEEQIQQRWDFIQQKLKEMGEKT